AATALHNRWAGTSAASGVGWSRSYAERATGPAGRAEPTSRTAALTEEVPTSRARMCMSLVPGPGPGQYSDAGAAGSIMGGGGERGGGRDGGGGGGVRGGAGAPAMPNKGIAVWAALAAAAVVVPLLGVRAFGLLAAPAVADVRPVPAGHQEVALLAAATSGDT